MRLLDGELRSTTPSQRSTRRSSTLRASSDERGLGRAELLRWLGALVRLQSGRRRPQRRSVRGDALRGGGLLAGRVHRHAGGGAVLRRDTGRDGHAAVRGAARASRRIAMTEANRHRGPRWRSGLWPATPTRLGRCSIMPARLYEDLGNSRGCSRSGRRSAIEAELLAGDLDAATASRGRTSRRSRRSASWRTPARAPLELADSPARRATTRRPSALPPFAERDALASDVLVQFLRRSLRARLLARGGDVASALRRWRGTRSRLASLTDALRDRARATSLWPRCSSSRETTRRAPEPKKAARRGHLLRQKGVKGALVGAPFHLDPGRLSLRRRCHRRAGNALPHGAPPFVRPRSSGAQTARSRPPNGRLTAARRWLSGPRSGPLQGSWRAGRPR